MGSESKTYAEQFAELVRSVEAQDGYWAEVLKDHIADFIYDEMQRQGVTKAELARRMGSTPPHISKILGGYQNLTLESLARVAFHLGKKWEVRLVDLECRELAGGKFEEPAKDATAPSSRKRKTA